MTNMTKEQVVTLTTDDLWAIVNSTNPATTMFASELKWAKEELDRRANRRHKFFSGLTKY